MNAHKWKLFTRKWTRTLHIYLSMLGLLVLVFFAATGFMLNHEEWFGFGEARVTTKEGEVPKNLLEDPDKLSVVELLRKDHGASGAMESFEVEDDQLLVTFKSPGRRTQAIITRPDGQMEVTHEDHGAMGRITGLHRGVDAGPAWRLVIDASALLFLIIGLSGLTLWAFVPKWRPIGLLAVAASVAICLTVYFTLVP